jgi:hypothetical protein
MLWRQVRGRPSVDFTYILHEAFMSADPKSAKKVWQFDCILALLVSSHVKFWW